MLKDMWQFTPTTPEIFESITISTMHKLLIFLIFFISLQAMGAEKSTRKEATEKPFLVNFNLNYFSLSNSNGQSLSGQGLELNILYAIKPKWGIGMAVKQMSLGEAGSASAINFKLTYALWGSLHKEKQKIYYENDLIVEKESLEKSCLCIQLLGSQYFLNATQSTIPFTGYGAAVYYRHPFRRTTSIVGGLNYETMTNVDTVTALSLSLGLEFRI